VLDREIAGQTPRSTLELAALLLDEAKVAIVPGEAFGAPGYARLTFAVSDEDIDEGIQRIAKLLA
jgi:aspartate aminotransferase